MAPPHKPTHLKVITGNPGKRPIVPDSIQPAQPSKPLAPPAHLNAAAKTEWKRLALQLHRLGLLTELDRAAFEAYCVTYATYRQAETQLRAQVRSRKATAGGMVVTTAAGNLIHNPVFSIREKALRDLVKYAAEFGFTPSARAKVQNNAPAAVGKAPQQPEKQPESFFED